MQSEYYEPKKLPGERAYPQIILDAEKLYALLLQAESEIAKLNEELAALPEETPVRMEDEV